MGLPACLKSAGLTPLPDNLSPSSRRLSPRSVLLLHSFSVASLSFPLLSLPQPCQFLLSTNSVGLFSLTFPSLILLVSPPCSFNFSLASLLIVLQLLTLPYKRFFLPLYFVLLVPPTTADCISGIPAPTSVLLPLTVCLWGTGSGERLPRRGVIWAYFS